MFRLGEKRNEEGIQSLTNMINTLADAITANARIRNVRR